MAFPSVVAALQRWAGISQRLRRIFNTEALLFMANCLTCQITTVPTLVEQNQLFAETVQVGLVVY
jgi:hypothetical protein